MATARHRYMHSSTSRQHRRHRRPRGRSTITLGAIASIVACTVVLAAGALQTAGAASINRGRSSGGGSGSSQSGAQSRRGSTPGAPTNVVATAGIASATVVWTPPTSSGGSTITAYVITPSTGSPVTVGGGASNDVVTGLTNGTTYTFTVTAVNGRGAGPASSASNPVTPEPGPVRSGSAPAFLVPLYDSSGADWSSACSGLAGTQSFVVADIGNPGGPGTAESPGWASNIGDCGNAHVGVLGYVDTGFCQVPLATVESQVDEWYSWYGTDGLSGIFFDEAANPSNPGAASDCLSRTTSAISYYESIAAYAHGKATGQTVTFNFGVNPVSSWPLSSSVTAQNADIVVIFEDPYSDYVDYGGSGVAWSPSAWEASFGAKHFSVLAYDAAGSGLPAAFCAAASGQNVGNVYVTPSSGWESLPPGAYLSTEVADC